MVVLIHASSITSGRQILLMQGINISFKWKHFNQDFMPPTTQRIHVLFQILMICIDVACYRLIYSKFLKRMWIILSFNFVSIWLTESFIRKHNLTRILSLVLHDCRNSETFSLGDRDTLKLYFSYGLETFVPPGSAIYSVITYLNLHIPDYCWSLIKNSLYPSFSLVSLNNYPLSID